MSGIWQQAELPGSHGSLYGVACPTTSFCVSGDMFGNVLTASEPAGPATAWTTTPTAATVQITGTACASTTECVIVDNNGDALASTDPTGGSGWIVQNLIPFDKDPTVHIPNALWSASCPTAEFCAIGATGEVLTSSNPLAPPPPPTPTPAEKGKGKAKVKHKPRPKRPRVYLSDGSVWPEVVVPHGKALLQFRFHADSKFQVRGYVCSFDHHKMHRCQSPQRFRVGPGHHLFAVRAVGWTGLWGPVVTRPILICRHRVGNGFCRPLPGR